MKRSWIYIIIGLMTLSLLGLSLIQYKYFKNTLTLKEAQFHYTVDMAMNQVGQEIRQHQSMERVRRDRRGRQALERLDSIQHVMSSGWSQDKGYYMKDTVVITDDGALKMSYTSYRGEGPELKSSSGTADFDMVYNDEWLQGFLADMLDPAFQAQQGALLDYSLVDSIVQRTFSRLGIDTEVELGIFNAYNEPLLVNRTTEIEPLLALSQAQHRMQLPQMATRAPREYLHVVFPKQNRYIMNSVWPMLMSSGLLMFIIMSAFALTIYTILRQKRSSEVKNDFISNMTHELKTPVSTIALACEALSDADMRAVPGISERYVSMIRDENARLGTLVENVLQSAIVDRGQLRLNKESLSVHELVHQSLATAELAIQKRQGQVNLHLEASSDLILGDSAHIQNVIDNLIDNAIKYSPERPVLTIATYKLKDELRLEIGDQGIGISKSDQKRIFDTLYRVPTGNTHDVKGFGLGLSYVKAIVDGHDGQIDVESDLGLGTRISIQLPIYES